MNSIVFVCILLLFNECRSVKVVPIFQIKTSTHKIETEWMPCVCAKPPCEVQHELFFRIYSIRECTAAVVQIDIPHVSTGKMWTWNNDSSSFLPVVLRKTTYVPVSCDAIRPGEISLHFVCSTHQSSSALATASLLVYNTADHSSKMWIVAVIGVLVVCCIVAIARFISSKTSGKQKKFTYDIN